MQHILLFVHSTAKWMLLVSIRCELIKNIGIEFYVKVLRYQNFDINSNISVKIQFYSNGSQTDLIISQLIKTVECVLSF